MKWAVLVALAVLFPLPVAARQAEVGATDTTFRDAVTAYRDLVTPRCRPELVNAYRDYAWSRDVGFVQSLVGRLRQAYLAAVRALADRDKNTVFHCDLPPAPPPPPSSPGTPVDERSQAIARAQERWREQSANLPAYFDAADAAFNRMVQARDVALAGGN